MPFFRLFALLLLIAAAVLLMGALSSQPAGPPELKNRTPCSAAVEILDKALARLGPPGITWLETTLWQKARLDGFVYESVGRYLAGPDNRLRLELTTRHGSAAATFLLVSDGKVLWEGTHVGDGGWTGVSRVELKQVFQTIHNSGPLPQLRDEFLHSQSFGGVVPLLQSLRASLTWMRKETVRRNGHIFVKLTGTWSDSAAKTLAPPDRPWPEGLPRQCRLYLDAETLWPHRIEWWGGNPSQTGDSLLIQMEFRDPILNQPLSAERCAHDFAIPFGSHPGVDQTPATNERLRVRAQQLLAQQAPAR